jgi:hypothetical protein
MTTATRVPLTRDECEPLVDAGCWRGSRAGVPEYWVVDLAARRLVVHREPLAAQRRYEDVIERDLSQPATSSVSGVTVSVHPRGVER